MIETNTEEEAFRQRRLRAGLAQCTDRRQQQLRDFLAAGIDAFQVAAQHIERVAQRGQLPVAILARTDGNVGGQLEDFLGEQFGTGQFDQIERAADLFEVLDGLLQKTAVVAIDDEMLKALLGLFHSGEQLIPDQTE